MNTSNVNNMLSYRLRKLSKSGVSANEMAEQLRALMEADRAQKMPADRSQTDFLLPFIKQHETHLSVV